ncbi:hypothetical protein GCM10027403_15420 [Arthrobacter tecti]
MSSRSPRPLRRRPARTIPAVITAVVLLILGAGALWLGIDAARGNTGVLESAAGAARTPWNSSVAVAVAGVVLAAGLILMLCAALPGKFTSLRLGAPTNQGTTTTTSEYVMSRHALARLAKARAEQVDGVESAAATASQRKLEVTVSTYLIQTAELRERVHQALTRALQDAGPLTEPRIRVSANTHKLD